MQIFSKAPGLREQLVFSREMYKLINSHPREEDKECLDYTESLVDIWRKY